MSATIEENKIEAIFKALSVQAGKSVPAVICRQYVNAESLENPLLETPIQKKKRIRKRHKKKKALSSENQDSTDNAATIDLKIKAVSAQVASGSVFGKRNSKCQYVSTNLYENVETPRQFCTEPSKILSVAPKLDDSPPYHHKTPQNVSTMDIGTPKLPTPSNLPSSESEKKGKKKKARVVANTSVTPKQSSKFSEYFDKTQVDAGLRSGELIKGIIRINPKNYRNAYVPHIDRSNQDYIITSIVDRNRALEGDTVVIKVKPEAEWLDNQKSAEVVYIYEKVHPRTAVGSLSVKYNQGKKMAVLQPRDQRIPRVIVPQQCLPPMFFKNPVKYESTLYVAKIFEWNDSKFAVGTIEALGKKGFLKDETKAILMEHELNVEPFPPSIRKFLPESSTIPSEEFEYREDLRKECVFTIDPLTARDLDDAVSCKTLPNGNLEVGVHIADVTHCLHPDTELDHIVAKKGTTVYLVDQVYHMLPVEMCMHLSLLPGKDSLAFSVFWEMTPDGEIISKRFTRSVINSCAQLAYEHAQDMIEDKPMQKNNLPDIYNGYKVEDLIDIVKKLQRIAIKLREKRFDSGALRIDQVKILFRLNEKAEPTDFFISENKDANRLIEEFMLLANISVAQKIKDDFPDIAFLRCHEPPNPRLIGEVQKTLEAVGIHLDTSSSGALHATLQQYSTSDYLGMTRNAVLNHFLAKPMTRARYFCASVECNFEHYALSTPIYTHFTSPIRRYADIMVHRLLSASLGYTKKPNWAVDYVQEIAANCNKQKFNAKRAGESHSDLYLLHFIEKNQPFIREAVVIDVREKYFDVMVLSTGSVVRIFLNNFPENVQHKSEKVGSGEKKLWKMTLEYPTGQVPQIIEIFQLVKVALKRKGNSNDLEGELLAPE